jgi:ribulose-phosphate 3-epimerase
MSVICPTVTAYDVHEYRTQLEQVQGFAKRIHVDLMDGIFAPTKSPDLDKLWLPNGSQCDIHIMFQHPAVVLKELLRLKPAMVIVQAEANFESVKELQQALLGSPIRFGISLLASTRPDDDRYVELVRSARHVLIFSGHLGYHGGKADLSLLEKVAKVRELNPRAEIAWDGGVSIENVKALSEGGVDVLNVGGAIQKTTDPEVSYNKLIAALA